MTRTFRTVDLFAGPGGLSEGFSALCDSHGNRVFEVALSVEKEAAAFRTLLLRSFVRKFKSPPPEYYAYIEGRMARQALVAAHSKQWQAAEREAYQLELGTTHASRVLNPLLEEIRRTADGETVLIGGPPCQAYSLVGRARNKGTTGYDPADDRRHFLYQEYIRIIRRLQPIAFVMENVKGILSSRVEGERVFEQIIKDLRRPGGRSSSYELVPLVSNGRGNNAGHIIRAEHYGIPQARHRVILVGVRSDHARNANFGEFSGSSLRPLLTPATVADVLDGLPQLRSGLSRNDSPEEWLSVAKEAFALAAKASAEAGKKELAARLETLKRQLIREPVRPRSSTEVRSARNDTLANWLCDPALKALPQHEARGHMPSDLARYAFVATFASIYGRSPKAAEFPAALAPDHANWATGKFADRFRCQTWDSPATTITSHISKDGHYFIHPDPLQCRSLTVREAARLQTFPDNYFFEGNRTQQFVQVGNAVPPLLGLHIAQVLANILGHTRELSGRAA